MRLLPIYLLLSLSAGLCAPTQLAAQSPRPRVELYLLKTPPPGPNGPFFQPTAAQLADTALLADVDLLGYDISRVVNKNAAPAKYELRLSEAGQQKLRRLPEVPLCCGLPFALVLNGQPVFGGYFWNPLSSFGAEWVVIPAWTARSASPLRLEGGLGGGAGFTRQHADPRRQAELLKAFRKTGRLREF